MVSSSHHYFEYQLNVLEFDFLGRLQFYFQWMCAYFSQVLRWPCQYRDFLIPKKNKNKNQCEYEYNNIQTNLVIVRLE